ncbi:IclR family transcriptional regulator [Dactylosporangium fulvum]|uniref:IclR family transcriptional regulator n=1 Tax=Dactylosporangium fulvum TaxID=53359 RepID=A0ABY5W670_9ACTN|nr:IclR family transcriptional regulator [Dactylosporangium fulvum]UWP85567.1 IclR family transcriptional regulator [Dactylosporangium fulvum]
MERDSLLGKVRLILDSFGPEDAELSLAQLVARTAVAKASVYRICQDLVDWGLLERSGQRYQLGLRLFELGQQVPRQRVLRRAALPIMDDLFRATQETIHLGVLDGLQVLYIDKIAPTRHEVPASRVGGRMPLHCTATGKALLANAPAGLVEAVTKAGLARLTPYTITQRGMMHRELKRIRELGYAVEREECVLGNLAVAVAVLDGEGEAVGALSITAPSFRADPERLASALRVAQHTVSRRLMSYAVSPAN